MSTVAFADEQGHKAAASPVIAVHAFGSVVAGLVFGLLDLTGPAARRWLVGVCAMAVSMIPLQLAGNLPFLAVALFVAGPSVAPTMVTTMALVEAHVPRSKLTEGMSWTTTGLAVGVALGASTAGWTVDAAGAGTGYAVSAAAGAVAAAVAFPGYRRLSGPVTVRGGHGPDDQDPHRHDKQERVA